MTDFLFLVSFRIKNTEYVYFQDLNIYIYIYIFSKKNKIFEYVDISLCLHIVMNMDKDYHLLST